MSSKKYVLRLREYGYNDEYYDFYYDFDDQKMVMAFHDEATAIRAWKAMERKTVIHRYFSSTQSFCEQSDQSLLALNQFLEERAGISLTYQFDGSGRVYVSEGIQKELAKLDEDTLFEFLRDAGMCSFFLNVFDQEDRLYVAYVPASGTYLVRQDYYQSGHDGLTVSATSDSNFLSMCCYSYLGALDAPLILEGTLESLSDSPSILASVISENDSLHYDSDTGRLSFGSIPFRVELDGPPLIAPHAHTAIIVANEAT